MVWLLIGAVITIAPMALIPEIGWLPSFLGLSLYSVAGPLACAFSDRWWLNAVLSSAGWLAIFLVVGALPATTALREGATVFLLPMMIYPCAVLLSGIIRVVRWRAATAPGATPTP